MFCTFLVVQDGKEILLAVLYDSLYRLHCFMVRLSALFHGTVVCIVSWYGCLHCFMVRLSALFHGTVVCIIMS